MLSLGRPFRVVERHRRLHDADPSDDQLSQLPPRIVSLGDSLEGAKGAPDVRRGPFAAQWNVISPIVLE